MGKNKPYISKYRYEVYHYCQSGLCENFLEQEIFYKMKKEMGIKKKVELICSEYCNSPMTSGILSSFLILPKWTEEIEENKYEYMLQHELVHIKHHDLLIK